MRDHVIRLERGSFNLHVVTLEFFTRTMSGREPFLRGSQCSVHRSTWWCWRVLQFGIWTLTMTVIRRCAGGLQLRCSGKHALRPARSTEELQDETE